MRSIKAFIAVAFVAVLAACGPQTNLEVERLNSAQAVGTPFTQYLTAEYRQFSNALYYDRRDSVDGIHFARKGEAAAQGENVMPEPIEDWNLSEAEYLELGEAREMLVIVLENGARELAADRAAAAQARFDCWVEWQEENRGAREYNCKSEFYSLLNELQSIARPPEPPPVMEEAFPEPIAAAPATEPVRIEEALFIVFFDWDKSNLTSGALDVINAVVAEVSARDDISRIIVTGHTDTSGPADYNERLSMRRAQAGKTALVERGIDENMIETRAAGQRELLVDTADNVREPANRRVAISLE